jgi:hypothetical protein
MILENTADVHQLLPSPSSSNLVKVPVESEYVIPPPTALPTTAIISSSACAKLPVAGTGMIKSSVVTDALPVIASTPGAVAPVTSNRRIVVASPPENVTVAVCPAPPTPFSVIHHSTAAELLLPPANLLPDIRVKVLPLLSTTDSGLPCDAIPYESATRKVLPEAAVVPAPVVADVPALLPRDPTRVTAIATLRTHVSGGFAPIQRMVNYLHLSPLDGVPHRWVGEHDVIHAHEPASHRASVAPTHAPSRATTWFDQPTSAAYPTQHHVNRQRPITPGALVHYAGWVIVSAVTVAVPPTTNAVDATV